MVTIEGVPDLRNNNREGRINFVGGAPGFRGLDTGDQVVVPKRLDGSTSNNVYTFVGVTDRLTNSVGLTESIEVSEPLNPIDCNTGEAALDVSEGKHTCSRWFFFVLIRIFLEVVFLLIRSNLTM